MFSHTVWATDLPNSVCVTVPGSPVPLQKQTWFSFPTPLMGSLFFFLSQHRQRSLQVPLLGIFSFFSLFLQWERGDIQSCISDCILSLWWMSCFLLRFLFMTVTIHFSAYRHSTVCRYVMCMLFYAELIYTLFCNGIFFGVFCFVWGLLWPQVLIQNEMLSPNIIKRL